MEPLTAGASVSVFFAVLDACQKLLWALKTAEALISRSQRDMQPLTSELRRLQDALTIVEEHYERMPEKTQGHETIILAIRQDLYELTGFLCESISIPKWCCGAMVDLGSARSANENNSDRVPSLARVKQLILLALSQRSVEDGTMRSRDWPISQHSDSRAETYLSVDVPYYIFQQGQENAQTKATKTPTIKREPDPSWLEEQILSKASRKAGYCSVKSTIKHRQRLEGASSIQIGSKKMTVGRPKPVCSPSLHEFHVQMDAAPGNGSYPTPELSMNDMGFHDDLVRTETGQQLAVPVLDQKLQEHLTRTLQENKDFWKELNEIEGTLCDVRTELNHLKGCSRHGG